jgi:putative transposase
MKRKRFGEEQIIGILSEAAAGATAVEVCRRHGVSETTFYRWKAKFGGMAVSDARRLRQLEAENTRLKRLLADAHLDNAALKDLLAKMETFCHRASCAKGLLNTGGVLASVRDPRQWRAATLT